MSTEHMPCSAPQFGDVRWTEHEHGFLVWVSGEARELPPVPGWLVEIMAYAIQQECLLINFDQDGDPSSLFRKWEW